MFCVHFDAWKGRVRPTMRQTHVGGEKVFVDFAGDTIDVIDPVTGEARAMKLYVAAMGASNHTYAEAVATEGLEDWIGAHVRMFAFLGGVPKVVVPDNLKAAVGQGRPLRSRAEPHLCRDNGALRNGDPTRPTTSITMHLVGVVERRLILVDDHHIDCRRLFRV